MATLKESNGFHDGIVEFAAEVYHNLEKYRQKNVNKFYREKELEFAEYTKMERYKNRVRVADIILQPLKKFLVSQGALVPTDDTNSNTID